jgi:hypothetical protein
MAGVTKVVATLAEAIKVAAATVAEVTKVVAMLAGVPKVVAATVVEVPKVVEGHTAK